MTDQLVLRPVTAADVDALFAIYADPATWRHLPSGRFTAWDQMAVLAARWDQEWREVGLSSWAVELYGEVVGSCGVMPRGDWWNLGFRFTPRVWGRGVATHAARSAVEAAHTCRPDWPVVSRSLATNPASAAVGRKAGLQVRWTGPSHEGADRVVQADRPLDPALLEAIIALG